MSFEHSCFISYRGSKDAMTQQFITELVEAINLCTAQLLGGQTAYFDKARLQGGDRYNAALSTAMVKSYCMVAVLSPGYIGSDFCHREYFGMLRIEDMRRNGIGKPAENRSLVIPLHVWGPEEDLPKEILNNVHLIRMPYGLKNRSTRIDCDPNFIPFLEDLSKIIYSHFKDYPDDDTEKKAITCCHGFALPDAAEHKKWELPPPVEPPFPGKKRKSTSKRRTTR